MSVTPKLSIRAEYQHIRYNDTESFALNQSKYTFANPIGQANVDFNSETTLGLALSYQFDKTCSD